jgi:hypothetical protein
MPQPEISEIGIDQAYSTAMFELSDAPDWLGLIALMAATA